MTTAPLGRLLLIGRLGIADIKRQPVHAALLLVMIATTTTTLTLGLALREVTDRPTSRTRAATRGPDVVAQIGRAPELRERGRDRGDPAVRLAPARRGRGHGRVRWSYPFALRTVTAPGIHILGPGRGRRPRSATWIAGG